jgi:membrane-anchored protein YejM (alkaline phosphatase superfamily)
MPNHLVLIIMDSCRYDSCVAARTPNIDRIGLVQQRYSYGSFTPCSHAILLMGILPHKSPTHTFASEVYKTEFADWIDRLGVQRVSFKTFVPYLSLAKVLRDLGYRTVGRVSLPVLNKYTAFSNHFDDYELMDDHNDFAGMVRYAEFSSDQPVFYFFNLGETHYPYMLADLPKISGVHGVFKHQAQGAGQEEGSDVQEFFDPAQMQMLKDQQVRCVEYIDRLIGKLIEKAPENTFFIVTSDHGELFGEDGYFGHGPIMHPKCFEVPFVEGMRPFV